MLTSCEHLGKQKQWTRPGQPSSAGVWWILWEKLSETNYASSPVDWKMYLGCSASSSALRICFHLFILLWIWILMPSYPHEEQIQFTCCQLSEKEMPKKKIVWRFPANKLWLARFTTCGYKVWKVGKQWLPQTLMHPGYKHTWRVLPKHFQTLIPLFKQPKQTRTLSLSKFVYKRMWVWTNQADVTELGFIRIMVEKHAWEESRRRCSRELTA